MHSDFSGIEFDWLAKDADGNIALFATAGEGFIPNSAADHHENHTAISESIPSPNTGTEKVWSDYAAVGLYVFDWDLPGGPYKLRAVPLKPASPELISAVEAVPQIPRLNGRFASFNELSKWQ
jgi:hypothetical protein